MIMEVHHVIHTINIRFTKPSENAHSKYLGIIWNESVHTGRLKRKLFLDRLI
jgi:hypothetical protein